jgi:hypothetical protein
LGNADLNIRSLQVVRFVSTTKTMIQRQSML